MIDLALMVACKDCGHLGKNHVSMNDGTTWSCTAVVSKDGTYSYCTCTQPPATE